MKQRLRLIMMTLLCAVFSSAWADEVYYTLTPVEGSNNGYANNCDIEINGITWNVTGNSTMLPWRIGGKSLSGVDRTVYSKTAMDSEISKVNLTVGSASGITVNSLKLTVASNKDFSKVIDEVSADFVANSIITFEPSKDGTWAEDAYYKFTFNVTVGSNNKFLQFTKAEFYKPGSEISKLDPALSFNKEEWTVNIGDEVKLPDLSNDYDVAVSFSSTNTDVATIDNEGNITLIRSGSSVITASSEEDDEYKASSASFKLIVKKPAAEGEIFHESFDSFNGTGGKNGEYKSVGQSNFAGDPFDENSTDKTWTDNVKVYSAYLCARFGTSKEDGKLTTTIQLTGKGTLTFEAAGWEDDKTNTLSVAAEGANLTFKDRSDAITLSNGEWKEYEYDITDATGEFTLTFEGKRGFIDEIVVKAVKEDQPIIEPEDPEDPNGPVGPDVDLAGYYTIKNVGNDKYINVVGRRTVNFVDDNASAPGTVYKLEVADNQVKVLRSQGVDLPGYAEKAMNYVPKIVQLVVDKLHASGSGEILGATGYEAIMEKFNECFDYHLYVEQGDKGYRIYGKTPSIQHVVDFYGEHRPEMQEKLPQLEGFINNAIDKVLAKLEGHGASVLKHYSIHEVWERMTQKGITLTEPVAEDLASIQQFFEEVFTRRDNTWNFAYETAMIYWEPLINHPKVQENLGELGDYAKYLDKIENIHPNFKYYIVRSGNGVDFISQGNEAILNNDDNTYWTLTERSDFDVTFNNDNVKNRGKEHWITFYADFGYTLPENVKAYKVTAINETTGFATTEEITGTIPAQTPVLLMTTAENLTQKLTLADGGTAVTDNLLKGNDYLISEYAIQAEQLAKLFNKFKLVIPETLYENYVKEYEHLLIRNAGTVNNKYFFPVAVDPDLTDAYNKKNGKDMTETIVRTLSVGEKKLGFYPSWDTLKGNEAYIIDDHKPVMLTVMYDVDKDGDVDVDDVTALVNIILELDGDKDYDYDAADTTADKIIDSNDVTPLVNYILSH